MQRLSVAVVGAGIHGLSAARHIAERGHRVTLFDRFPPGHRLGSSHGRSRIVRRAYPDPFYTRCMLDAYPLWAELERAGGRQLVREVGLLYFGKRGSTALQTMAGGLTSLNVPFQRLDAGACAALMPALRLSQDEIGIFTPEAGWVAADDAMNVTWSLAQSAGAEFEQREAGLADLDAYDGAVVCPGPWIGDFVKDTGLRVTLQATAYVQARVEGPVWIEDGPNLLYGFPSDGAGLKIGVHRQGETCDPNSDDRTPPADMLEQICDFAERRFGLDRVALTQSTGCLYTSADDDDFRFFRLGQRQFLFSPCSGHGFKFGPWIGKLAADFVERLDAPESYPRFLRAPVEG